MRRLTSLLGIALGLYISNAASAQTFGSQGSGVISVERVFGIHGTHRSTENLVDGQDDETEDATGITFAWRGSGEGAGAAASAFDAPRAAFDYFIIERVSVGGALAWASVSLEDAGADSASAFLFAPRAGYAYMFSNVVGIWPRGGVTYHSAGVDPGASENGLALTLEGMFVFVPAQHFAVLVGPTLDLDIIGSFEPEAGPERDRRYRTFALQVGMSGWF
jgi:hypothetical protein